VRPRERERSGRGRPGARPHLVCYLAKLTKLVPKQPKFVRRDVSTSDELGAQVLRAKAFVELCVPSFAAD
jgi:hypothetical protein